MANIIDKNGHNEYYKKNGLGMKIKKYIVLPTALAASIVGSSYLFHGCDCQRVKDTAKTTACSGIEYLSDWIGCEYKCGDDNKIVPGRKKQPEKKKEKKTIDDRIDDSDDKIVPGSAFDRDSRYTSPNLKFKKSSFDKDDDMHLGGSNYSGNGIPTYKP